MRAFGEPIARGNFLWKMRRVIWSSNEAHLVNALATGGDEGRRSLRKASGSRLTDFDPEMSEWGNPPDLSGILT